MSKYLALIYGEEVPPESVTPEQQQQVMMDYLEFGRNAETVLRGGAALHDSSSATTVRVEGGKGGSPIVTDGPFAETKEVLGGYYVIEADDLDEALTWAQQVPGAWYGRVEVRPVMEFDEAGQPVA